MRKQGWSGGEANRPASIRQPHNSIGDKQMSVTIPRQVNVTHGEAFQLMLYRPSKGSGPDCWLWNSRDGVTPFGMTLGNIDYTHAMNAYRPVYCGSLPDEAEFVWVDYDRTAWSEMLARRWDRLAASDDPVYGGVAFLKQFPNAQSFSSIEPYRAGEPRRLTRVEFLEQTSSWVTRAMEQSQ